MPPKAAQPAPDAAQLLPQVPIRTLEQAIYYILTEALKPSFKKNEKQFPIQRCIPHQHASSVFSSRTAISTDPVKEQEKKSAVQTNLPPLSNLQDIFEDIALKVSKEGLLEQLLGRIGQREIRIGTICSGTESPILALNEFCSACQRLGNRSFRFKHEFSCEIETFKQAYIQRNFEPPVIFRDVREFRDVDDDHPTATSVYNVPHTIPTDLDMLVAGFSCIDFSNLNNQKKSLADNGESAQTFFGIMAYAKRFRPRLIILENIQGCPWKSVVEELTNIGYVSKHIMADPREYYLPQTRNRGYLVAFDAGSTYFRAVTQEMADSETSMVVPRRNNNTAEVVKDVTTATSLVKQWDNLMKNTFKRPASSPFFSFILQDGDPMLLLTKHRLSNDEIGSNGQKFYDWVECRGRHQGVRLEHGLGWGRPQTRWQSNGACKPRDPVWVTWAKSQQERNLDTLDVSYLRKLRLDGIDQNFKPRILDLNQNVDRDADRRQPGIFPCVLPNGLNFLTTRGGIIIGRESLALQGLPVDSLILTKETNKELQVLAGNAMSSTVVGCAMLSALITGYPLLEHHCNADVFTKTATYTPEETTLKDFINPARDNDWFLQEKQVSRPWMPITDLNDLGVEASQNVQLCACEGRSLVKDREFLLCEDCGHSVCTTCGGNPRHNYKHLGKVSPRGSPIEFNHKLRATLPPIISLTGLSIPDFGGKELFKNPPTDVKEKLPDKEEYVEQIDASHSLYLTSIDRKRFWTISYENRAMKLDLIIKPKMLHDSNSTLFKSVPESSTFEWLLFFKPHPREPLGSEVSKRLASPKARMTPENGLLNGTWQVFDANRQTFDITFQGFDGTSACYEGQVGMETDELVFRKLKVIVDNNVNPKIKTPEEVQQLAGVYEWFADCGGPNGSLHKQIEDSKSTRTTDPTFLFLDPAPLSRPQDDSFVFAKDHGRMDWREHRPVICKLKSTWKPDKIVRSRCSPVDLNGANTKTEFKSVIEVEGLWKENLSLRLDANQVIIDRWLPEPAGNLNLHLGSCHDAKLGLIAFEVLLGEAEVRHWSHQQCHTLHLSKPAELSFLTWQKADLCTIADNRWKDAAPYGPVSQQTQSHWCEICMPRRTKVKFEIFKPIKGRSNRMAIEAERNSVEWETRMKHRPAGLSGQLLRTESSQSFVRIDANVQTLIHQAYAIMIDLGMMAENGSSLQSVQWRLAEDYPSKSDFQLPAFSLDNSSGYALIQQPPNLCRGRTLRNEQLRSLRWMLERERIDGRPFANQVIEEACLPALNARLEAKAVVNQQIRGGIVADEVGYGKTAIFLGLIDSTWTQYRHTPKYPGFIPTDATLIIVPNVITRQWEAEYATFLEEDPTFRGRLRCEVPLRKKPKKEDYVKELVVFLSGNKVDTQQIMEAKCVVISHNILGGKPYHDRLQETLDLSSPAPVKAGREYDQWLSETLQALAARVETSPPDRTMQDTQLSDNEVFTNDGKRQKSFEDTGEGSAKRTQFDPLQNLPGILHAFHWRRIVIDEYTYLDGQARQMARKLSADCKWIISGTPNLSNFSSVNEMAGLIGVSLGPYDDREGLSKSPGSIETISQDLTFVEQFQLLEGVRSAQWHLARHEHAQAFLSFCASNNRTQDITPIQSIDHFELLTLRPSERLFYSAMIHYLMSRDMTGRKTKKHNKNNTNSDANPIKVAVQRLIKESPHNPAALVRSCSNPPPKEAGSCEVLIKSKSEQLHETTKTLIKELQHVWWLYERGGARDLDPNPFMNFLKCIEINAYGDEQAMPFINNLIQFAKDRFVKPRQTLADIKKKQKAKDKASQEKEKAKAKEKAAKKKEAKQKEAAKQREAVEKAKVKAEAETDAEEEEMEDSPEDEEQVQDQLTEEEDSEDEADDDQLVDDDLETEFEKGLSGTQKDMFHRANHITDLTLDFVEHIRALRQFFLIDQYTNNRSLRRDCSTCSRKDLEPGEISVNLSCGHLLCHQCFDKAIKGDQMCGAKGCTGGLSKNSVVPASQFCSASFKLEEGTCTKFEEVCKLLKDHTRISEEDKVAIFVQYDDMTVALETALHRHDIKFVSVGSKTLNPKLGPADIRSLEAFKKVPAIKVCLLRSESPSAAGLNLQCANHVVFASTLLKSSKQAWGATMTQMIGRVKRFHQQKTVHVWHVLADRTIDVNVLQERKNGILELVGSEAGKPIYDLVPQQDQYGKNIKVVGYEGDFSGAVIDSNALHIGELALD